MEQVAPQFKAFVKYQQPRFSELIRRFTIGLNLSYLNQDLHPIERFKQISRQDRELTFELIRLDSEMAICDLQERIGVNPRFALYEELLGFAEKFPDEQRRFKIAALGSEMDIEGHLYIPFLWGDESERTLHLCSIERSLGKEARLLVVRE